MQHEIKAVQYVRALGADTSEELEAFREARRQRRLIETQLDLLFASRGWK